MLAGPMAAPSTYRDNPIGDSCPSTSAPAGPSTPEIMSLRKLPKMAKSLATRSLSPDVSARIWRNVNYMSLPNIAEQNLLTVLLRLRKPRCGSRLPLVAWHRYGTARACLLQLRILAYAP